MTLLVNDPEVSLAFYQKTFDVQVRHDDTFEMEGQTMRWLTVSIPGDSLEIALSEPIPWPDGRVSKAGDANMSVAEVDDVDAMHQAFLDAGGASESAPEDLPWGRSCVVRDPDGNPWNLVSPST